MDYMTNFLEAGASPKSERDSLMEQIMEANFAAIDLNLYLNTHPNDKKALAKFKEAVAKKNALTKRFEEKYGPLTAAANAEKDTWMWIENPYPWDKR